MDWYTAMLSAMPVTKWHIGSITTAISQLHTWSSMSGEQLGIRLVAVWMAEHDGSSATPCEAKNIHTYDTITKQY